MGLQGHLVQVLAEGVGEPGADDTTDTVVELLGGFLVGLDLELRLADLGHQFLDEADDFSVGLLGAPDGLEDDLLGHLVGAGFHHDDGITGAADDHAQSAVIALFVGGVDDVLAVPVGDAAGADGPVEGNLGDGQGSRCSDHGQDFRRVLLVCRQDCQGYLDVVVQALGEQRADGAVGQTGGENAFLSGTALAAEEAAWDAAGGVEPFFVVDGQGEEVDILGPWAVGHDGGGEDDGLAVADGDGAVGLEGEASGFEDQGFAADLSMDDSRGCQLCSHIKRATSLKSELVGKIAGSGTGARRKTTPRSSGLSPTLSAA